MPQALPCPESSTTKSELQREWIKLKAWSTQNYAAHDKETRKLIEMAKYVADMNAANYMMSNRQKLCLIMLVDGESWRAHSKQVFQYQAGAWQMVGGLKVDVWDIFLALEGLFLSVAEVVEADDQAPSVSWTWSGIEKHVDMLLRDPRSAHLGGLAQKAKESSDHLRKVTGNKTWQASWLRRVADMLASFRVQWDNSRAHNISKLFLLQWESPMPRSQGVCFTDIYLDCTWSIQEKRPSNNCYLSVPYPFHYESLVAADPKLDLSYYKNQLRLFLESLYFENEHVFQVKLCSLHAAFKKAPTAKMLFEVGKGGDGKGMEAYLERGLLGDEQSSTLDCGVFLDRQEFRKSGHFAWNKACLGVNDLS